MAVDLPVTFPWVMLEAVGLLAGVMFYVGVTTPVSSERPHGQRPACQQQKAQPVQRQEVEGDHRGIQRCEVDLVAVERYAAAGVVWH